MSYLCHLHLTWPCVALRTLAVAQSGSQFSEGHMRDRLATETCCCSLGPLTWSHSMAQGNFGDIHRYSRGGRWASEYMWTGAHMGSGHTH